MRNKVRYEFSLIIPTYNRPDQLAQCLLSLTHLHFPAQKFEVIVVDDGSDVSLKPIIGQFDKKINIKLIRQENNGPASARNFGAQCARGRYLAFTDDDCSPEPQWLSTIRHEISANPSNLIGGHTVNSLDQNIFSTTSQFIIDLVYAHYNNDMNRARFMSSNNMIVSVDDFYAIGGFDPAFRTSEDRDLCDRWLFSGRRMSLVPDAIIYHAHRLTCSSFWKLHVSYGQGAWYYRRAFAKRRKGHSTIEVHFYLDFLRRLPDVLSLRPKAQAGKILCLLVIWQIANAVGFYSAALKNWRCSKMNRDEYESR
jgi:glycosyltransferase involved in cell wall biosynthesis